MKKHLSLFVPLLALFLALSPQSMLADNPDYFTITNVHATQATAVHLIRSNSYAPAATLTFRILDKDDNVVLDWTTKTFSTTGTSTSNNTRFGSSTDVIPANGGKMQIYGNNSSGLGYTGGDSPYLRFVLVNGSQELSGNILSLVACSDGQTINNNFTLPTRCFKSIFQNCSTVVSAENLKLPSMTLSNTYQYQSLFQNCVNMVKGPKELPATAASGTGVYNSMFRGCSKLEEAPDIKAATWGTYGLNYMFNSCTLLNKIRIHTTYTSMSQATTWVDAVANSGEFYCPPTLTRSFSNGGIPKSTTYRWIVYSYNVTFILQAGTWEDATSANKQFTWETDVDNVKNFLDTEDAADAVFYESDGVTPVTIATIKSRLSTQQESSASTTKTYYVKKLATYHITFKDNGGTTKYEQDVLEGDMPSYAGESLDQSGYKLIWSPALYAANSDQIYTATYSLLYSFTAGAGGHGIVQLVADDYADAENSSSYASGTSVQMTVVADDGYRFVRWSDEGAGNTDNPRTVVTTSAAASYTAVMEVIPTHYARFYDEDGTTLKYEVLVREGSVPVYDGPTPTKQWHFFDGWTPAITAMGASDVAYTAVYVREPDYFTITNKHATASTSVGLKRQSSASPQTTLYYRIIDKDGNITTDWQSITMTSSGSTTNSIGSIPHGGKMQLYGYNSTCFCGTGSYLNYSTFSLSGGTDVLSGNLLSLVACSDGATIDNDFALTDYCFRGLFSGCTTLVSAEDLVLPSTTLSYRSYYGFFSGCTNLEEAPKALPATTMTRGCYYQMFQNCSKLTKSPDIYGQTFSGTQNSSEDGSMGSMFSGCTQLSSIRVYLTTQFSNSSYTTGYWVSNVQTTAGSFYCPRTLNRTQGGTYCIPSNWTIYSYNVTFVPVGGNWSDDTDENKQFTWRTDVSDVEGLLTSEAEIVKGYYRDAECTDEMTESDIRTVLTTRPSNDNTTYIYAKISPSVSYYALDWDANGGALSGDYTAAGDYEAGATITAPTATRAGYTYTWDPAFTGTMPAANTTYTAQWTQKSYTLDATASAGGSGVTRSDNGNSETVKRYGDNVVLTPVANTGYHFTGWTGTDARDLVDNEDGTYTLTIADKADNYEYAVTANFAPNTHRLTWTTDGNTLTGDYTHGEAIAYGTTVTAPDTPTKNATAEYTYTFNGWSPALDATMPDNDVTYTATWTETKRQYTLTWDVNGGNALTGTYTNGTIDWGTVITKPADPTKADYTFGGWDANNDGTADEVAATMPTTSLTYKAIWVAELPNITLCENCNNDHYNTFKSDYDRKTVNVTYPRQFSASKWSTMCLPFSLDLATMIANKMYGRVYEFKYATGNANTNSGVNLYFSNAKKIEAGNCYIVNADDALAAKTSFVFSGVTIDLTKDNGAALDSEDAYDDLPGYISQGTIELVGTLRNGTLKGSATGNRYMGLKDNKIYYPNISQGSTIWAYRGIFRSTETLNIEKMRIIVDGEDRGEIIIDADGEILDASGDAPSRKFFRDGVLYIEREGVVYDAQGKRVEGAF